VRSSHSTRSGKAAPRLRRGLSRVNGKKNSSAVPTPKTGRPDRLAARLIAIVQPHRAEMVHEVGNDASVLALAVPDWLAHTLTVTGPADRVAAFRAAARGPGAPPSRDRSRLEEDVMHALLAPPPALRGISLAGARILARQVGEKIEAHASRAARRSPACPFDLNVLLPVPASLSDLPPGDPRLSGWLWRHWGTTWPLRQVTETWPMELDPCAAPAGHSAATSSGRPTGPPGLP